MGSGVMLWIVIIYIGIQEMLIKILESKIGNRILTVLFLPALLWMPLDKLSLLHENMKYVGSIGRDYNTWKYKFIMFVCKKRLKL